MAQNGPQVNRQKFNENRKQVDASDRFDVKIYLILIHCFIAIRMKTDP